MIAAPITDVNVLAILKTYIPNPIQWQFHQSDSKYRAYIGGIRSGKTHAGSWELIRHLVMYPKSKALVVSPTYAMMRDSTLQAFLDNVPNELIGRRKDGTLDYNKESRDIRMFNGSVVKFRSADDPDKVRGMEVSFFWLDEGGQLQSGEMWDIGIGRMSQMICPQKAICTTTPNGMNWMYDYFITHKDSRKAVFYASTMENAKNLPKDYIKALQSQYSGQFYKQELMGQFVGFEGLVYPDFDMEIHVSDEMLDPWYDDTIVRVDAGIDWGVRDPTAVLFVGTSKYGKKYVYDEMYVTNVDLETLRPAIASRLSKYNVRKVYCDPSRPESIIMMNKVSPRQWECVKGANDIVNGIMAVSQYFKIASDGKPRMLIHPRCKNLIAELQMYKYSSKRKEGKGSEMPIGKNDHELDTLRYILATPEQEKYINSNRFHFVSSTRTW
jgi:PBSX family phage terminase large subunit